MRAYPVVIVYCTQLCDFALLAGAKFLDFLPLLIVHIIIPSNHPMTYLSYLQRERIPHFSASIELFRGCYHITITHLLDNDLFVHLACPTVVQN